MQRKNAIVILLNILASACIGFTFMVINGAGVAVAATGDTTAAQDKGAAERVPAIYLAAKRGKLVRLRALIATGADVNASNRNGRTALMGAVFYRNKAIARELLSEGANVDAGDVQGRTALMLAVANNDMEMARLLLMYGADVKVKDKKERSAITIAEKSTAKKASKKKLIKLLQKAAE